MSNDVIKKLVWAGILAGTGAIASIIAARAATLIYVRVYGEDPPD